MMWFANAVLTIGVVLVLLGWFGVRSSPGIARHHRTLITVGIGLILLTVAVGFVQGAIEGYHDALRAQGKPAR